MPTEEQGSGWWVAVVVVLTIAFVSWTLWTSASDRPCPPPNVPADCNSR